MRDSHVACIGQDPSSLAITLFQKSGEAHLLIDPITEQVLEVNEAACRLGQVPRQELIGLSFNTLFRPDKQKATANSLDHGRAGWLPEGYLFGPRPASRWIPVALRIDRVLNCKGDPTILLTLHRRGEQTRNPQSQRLESLGRFAGRIAHDFNNFITGILGHVSLARLELRDRGAMPSSLDHIETISLRAAGLCKQLNTVAGKISSLGFIADPASRIRAVLRQLEPGIPLHIQIRTEFEDDLPPLRLDGEELGLLVDTLVRNAVEACADQPAEIHVRLSRDSNVDDSRAPCFSFRVNEPAGPMLCLEVLDDGPGIPRDVQAHLGEPFLSPHGSHRGLGLALALGVLRAHRGEMHIYTQAGLGTQVRLLLPMSLSAVLDASATSDPPSPTRAAMNILLVDDEQMVRDVTGRLIQSLGHAVIPAGSGEEALRLLDQQGDSIQLALIDLTMPHMSGEETIRELRRRAPTLPIVIISGYPERDLTARFGDLAITAYLQKPFRLPALISLFDRLLRSRGS